MRQIFAYIFLTLVLSPLRLYAENTPNLSGKYFFNQANFATGTFPEGVAIADVNGDGRADVIVANSGDSSISILLGQPDGTLGLKTDITLPGRPVALVTGDFNMDGKVDLAVIESSGVAVLLGNGDGTFGSAVTYPLANIPGMIAISDFNKDGKSDLVVAGTCGTSCGFYAVLLGNGDGTFKVQSGSTPGGVPLGLAVFDLNQDGLPDLAFANSPSEPTSPYTLGIVSVLLGNGDGTFKAPVNYTSGEDIAGLTAGDVTGDKAPDLIVTHWINSTVALMKGNGDGTFQPEVSVSTDALLGTAYLQLLDLNHDGKLDLLMSSVDNGGAVVMMGNGDGTFQLPQVYATGSQPYFFAIGDVNGDGNVDWAMPDDYGNYVTILLGNGNGTFSPRTNLPIPVLPYGAYVNSTVIADFNGDGKLDIVAATQPGLSVMLGNGDGSFKTPIVADTNHAWTLSNAAVGDFNKDGHLDLIADGVTFLPGNGDGTFGAPVAINNDSFIRSFAVGDFDGDGNLDLLDVGNGFTESQPIQLLLGNGDGTFKAPKRFWNLTSIPDKVALGDFNKDGKLDIALTLNPNGVAILLGDGAGGFAAPVIYPTDDLPNGIAVADLDHDGNLDLVITGAKMDVFLGKGDGTFPNRVDYFTTGFPSELTTGDFNGDGKLDVAVTSYGSGPGYLGISFGNGDGTFQTPVTVTEYSSAGAPIAAADLNGDGVDDVLAAGANGSLFLSGPLATVTPSILNFGTVAVGAPTPSLPITITNSGNGPLNVSGADVASPFSIAGSICQAPLSRLDNCTIPVVFDPTAMGGHSGQIQIKENAANSKPTVFVLGTAIVPFIGINPATLDFGNEALSMTSPSQNITLTNTSMVAITISSVSATGPFAAASQCGNTLAPVSSCTISVTFAPLTTGQQNGSITISDNSSGSPHSVALGGSGVPAIAIAAQTGSSTTATVPSGSVASYGMVLAAGPGVSGTASLTCSGAPTNATCTVSPSSLALSSGGTGSFSVRVTTSQQVGNLNRKGFAPWAETGAVLCALFIPWYRRRSRVLSRLMLIALLCGLVCITACGGSSGSQPTVQNVAPGSYQLNITAAIGNATVTQKLTLVVQ